MVENLDWIAIAQRGFEAWKAKPHNARWFRKIDGTPIPNDLTICIGQAFADELARRSPPPAVEGGWRDKPTNANNMIGTRWRHKKRGSEYIVVDGMAEVQVSEGHELTDYECFVVYKGRDGRHWVRPRAEFLDGRFEALPTPPAGEKP